MGIYGTRAGALVAIALLPVGLAAQQGAARIPATLTLEEAIRIARENNPDYQNVELEILHLTNTTDRKIRLISERGMRLFTYDELEAMVRETYRLWQSVLEERKDAAARPHDDWDDGLFGSAAR